MQTDWFAKAAQPGKSEKTVRPKEAVTAPTATVPVFDEPNPTKPNPLGLTDAELLKQLKDPMWRMRNLYWIQDKEGREVLFAPNEVQEKFLNELWFRNVIPKARQRGFSTVVQIWMLDTALFNSTQTGAVIAQDMPSVLKIFRNKIKFAYDRLPAVIKAMRTLKKQTESEMVFNNDSSLYVAVSTRSGTIQMLHVSELGQISKKFPEKAREIQTGALPSVDQNGIIIIESTVESAAGMFPDMCRRAQQHQQLGRALGKMQYRLHFASWWDAEEYETDPTGIVIDPQEQGRKMREADEAASRARRELAIAVAEANEKTAPTFDLISRQRWEEKEAKLNAADPTRLARNEAMNAEAIARHRRETHTYGCREMRCVGLYSMKFGSVKSSWFRCDSRRCCGCANYLKEADLDTLTFYFGQAEQLFEFEIDFDNLKTTQKKLQRAGASYAFIHNNAGGLYGVSTERIEDDDGRCAIPVTKEVALSTMCLHFNEWHETRSPLIKSDSWKALKDVETEPEHAVLGSLPNDLTIDQVRAVAARHGANADIRMSKLKSKTLKVIEIRLPGGECLSDEEAWSIYCDLLTEADPEMRAIEAATRSARRAREERGRPCAASYGEDISTPFDD